MGNSSAQHMSGTANLIIIGDVIEWRLVLLHDRELQIAVEVCKQALRCHMLISHPTLQQSGEGPDKNERSSAACSRQNRGRMRPSGRVRGLRHEPARHTRRDRLLLTSTGGGGLCLVCRGVEVELERDVVAKHSRLQAKPTDRRR